jgi:hypothetical protein
LPANWGIYLEQTLCPCMNDCQAKSVNVAG